MKWSAMSEMRALLTALIVNHWETGHSGPLRDKMTLWTQ